jgi:hypothetical protein
LLLALVGATIPATGPAAAGPGAGCPPGQHNCDVWDGGGDGDTGGGNTGGGNNGGGGGPTSCYRDGRPVPCYDELLGWFNSNDGCYYKLMEPQPTGVPDGYQAYLRSCAGSGMGSREEVLLAAPPPGYGAPPDPVELAWRALASITLLPPEVKFAPQDGPGLVGLPVWLWFDRTTRTWGPNTAQASDRGVTVRIEAEVSHVDWNMGDNGPLRRCNNPGRPYTGQGGKSPQCGYDGYRKSSRSQPGGKYRITATSYWRVQWFSSSGTQGELPLQSRTSAPAFIQIDELQVVTG